MARVFRGCGYQRPSKSPNGYSTLALVRRTAAEKFAMLFPPFDSRGFAGRKSELYYNTQVPHSVSLKNDQGKSWYIRRLLKKIGRNALVSRRPPAAGPTQSVPGKIGATRAPPRRQESGLGALIGPRAGGGNLLIVSACHPANVVIVFTNSKKLQIHIKSLSTRQT